MTFLPFLCSNQRQPRCVVDTLTFLHNKMLQPTVHSAKRESNINTYQLNKHSKIDESKYFHLFTTPIIDWPIDAHSKRVRLQARHVQLGTGYVIDLEEPCLDNFKYSIVVDRWNHKYGEVLRWGLLSMCAIGVGLIPRDGDENTNFWNVQCEYLW